MACSASTKAARPPDFWASAMTCRAKVVFPLDSGPKISMILPRGRPPTPRARSSASAPVEMAGTFGLSSSPILMMDPLPNCRSIWVTAASIALLLSNASSTGRVRRVLQRDRNYPGEIILQAEYPPKGFLPRVPLGSARGLERVVLLQHLAGVPQRPDVLAVDLDGDGAGVSGPDADHAAGLEGARETGRGHLLEDRLRIRADPDPGRSALHLDADGQAARGSVTLRSPCRLHGRGDPLGLWGVRGGGGADVQADKVEGADEGGDDQDRHHDGDERGPGKLALLGAGYAARADDGAIEVAPGSRVAQSPLPARLLAGAELLGEPVPVEAEKVCVGLEEAPGVDGVRQDRVVVALEAVKVALADLGSPLGLFEGEPLVLARPLEDGPDLALRGTGSVLAFYHFDLEPTTEATSLRRRARPNRRRRRTSIRGRVTTPRRPGSWSPRRGPRCPCARGRR